MPTRSRIARIRPGSAFFAGIALAFAIAAPGCSDSAGERPHASSRRVFLQKLVLDPAVLHPAAEIAAQRIAAHDALGRVDVAIRPAPAGVAARPSAGTAAPAPDADAADGSTATDAEEGDAESAPADGTVADASDAEAAGDADGENAPEAPAPGNAGADAVADVALREALAARVQPIGRLEGYGEAAYRDGDGAPILEVVYRLTRYPVDYYHYAPATEAETTAAAVDQPPSPQDDRDEVAASDAAGEDAPSGNNEEPAEAVSVLVESVEPAEADDADGEAAGDILYRVAVDGLTAEVRAAPEHASEAELYAEALAARLVHEISVTRAALEELRADLADRGPGRARLTGFWGHLADRLSMEEKQYRILKAGF